MTTITHKRFTDGIAAQDEARTQIFFGNQAHVRGQWPNGTGYTVVIDKDDESEALPGTLCWAGFDANGVEWMVRHHASSRTDLPEARDIYTLYRSGTPHARFHSPSTAMDAYTRNGAR